MSFGGLEAPGLTEARKAIELIAQFHSPADSRSFAVWQAYARGADSILCSAIDGLIARRQEVDPDDIDFLYRTYVANNAAADAPQQLTNALTKEVQRILEAIEQVTGSASRYSHSLNQMSTRLDADLDALSLRQMVRQMTEMTQQTIAENETMRLNLNATRAELDAMRGTLDVVRAQSLTDELTQLANRRHFDATIANLFKGVRMRSEKLGLLMMDIDHFKRFNDMHGHQTGDRVLTLVAATIRKHVPAGAVAARYGGEEFAILLPEMELFQITRVAEAIRVELRGRELVKRSTGERLGRITVSGGIALAGPRDTTQSLINRADKCLGASKALGRDRTLTEIDLPPSAQFKNAS
ncbi:MAG: hypothetical protein BGP06_07275 [Rhizobiales bacterium 65-9]|nr:GGDEF domain-containing protein [Hyphomicrobiales bacterium]OJY35616.1 MAG: hypothetical protein BGP06_07275 [Rhizobiales bacterium 65-9]